MQVKEEEEAEVERKFAESFVWNLQCQVYEVEVVEVVWRSLVGGQEFELVEVGAYWLGKGGIVSKSR